MYIYEAPQKINEGLEIEVIILKDNVWVKRLGN